MKYIYILMFDSCRLVICMNEIFLLKIKLILFFVYGLCW